MNTTFNKAEVLVIAGGFGTRMSDDINILSCKSLIEYKGKTMIEYLIINLIDAGISKIIIATREGVKDSISKIVENIILVKPDVSISVIVETGGSLDFHGVVLNLESQLKDQFLVVCGHHPITSFHVKEMFSLAKRFDNVCSAYKNNLNLIEKLNNQNPDLKRVIYENGNFIELSIHDRNFHNDYVFIRNPYIFNKKDLLDYFSCFKKNFNDYIQALKTPVGFVEADFPPEFDYDFEYQETCNFL